MRLLVRLIIKNHLFFISFFSHRLIQSVCCSAFINRAIDFKRTWSHPRRLFRLWAWFLWRLIENTRPFKLQFLAALRNQFTRWLVNWQRHKKTISITRSRCDIDANFGFMLLKFIFCNWLLTVSILRLIDLIIKYWALVIKCHLGSLKLTSRVLLEWILLPFVILKIIIVKVYYKKCNIILAAFLHSQLGYSICNGTKRHSLLLAHLDYFWCHIFLREAFVQAICRQD